MTTPAQNREIMKKEVVKSEHENTPWIFPELAFFPLFKQERKEPKEEAKAGPWAFPELAFFPLFKQEPKKPDFEVRDQAENRPPARVSMGDRRPNSPPFLELEAEETTESTSNSNPAALWQVYILAGSFILKWALTAWNQRNKGEEDTKGLSDNEYPPPVDDEKYNSRLLGRTKSRSSGSRF